MESLTDLPQLKEPKPKGKASDRATLGKTETAKVDQWLKQINDSSKGFLMLTRSDIVNFLIREHRAELSPKEFSKIRADNYDPIRHITWITPQIKAAISNGDLARVADLQMELRGVELNVVQSALSQIDSVSTSPSSQKRQSRRARSKSPERYEGTIAFDDTDAQKA